MAVVVFLTLDEVHSNICVHKLRGNHFLVELQSKRNNGVLFGASSRWSDGPSDHCLELGKDETGRGEHRKFGPPVKKGAWSFVNAIVTCRDMPFNMGFSQPSLTPA